MKLFWSGFLIAVCVVTAFTPCSGVFVFPMVVGAFLVGVGRGSATGGEDTTEISNQLTLFAISALFGSLINLFLMIALGMRK
jgi:hypothetical protein